MTLRGAALALVVIVALPVGAGAGGWVLTTFYPASSSGIYVAAADLAGSGARPAAVVFDLWGTRVLYAPDPLGGSGFQQVPMTVPSSGAVTMRLALADGGAPHVFVLRDDGRTFALVHATRAAARWSFETVASGASSSSFRLHDVAVDGAGAPHALASLAGVDALHSWSAGAWVARPLGTGLTQPHLARSPEGTLHACAGSTSGLVHAWGDALSWRQEVVGPGPLHARACSIDAPGATDVRITFDDAAGLLHHARRTTTGWVLSTLPAPASGDEMPATATTRGGDGAAFVATRAAAYGARVYGMQGTAWVEESPPGLLEERTAPFAAPGPAKPYVGTGSAALRIWAWS